MKILKNVIDNLKNNKEVPVKDLVLLLETTDKESIKYLSKCAQEVSYRSFNNKIYIRGLIEFTNYCKNDCYYCGIRKSNKNVARYRLSKEEILSCCTQGYDLGFRTFVLQGGENPYYTSDKMVDIISSIHKKYPDCAITISFGEHSKETYEKFYNAGADRYLLRHESSDPKHYKKLHPKKQHLQNRLDSLNNLKAIGFQTGCGFMVDSPYQTNEHIAKELLFIKDFEPEMIGVGPFIPHHDTKFAKFKQGSLNKTLITLSILRLMNPKALIPATTALGTIDKQGREQGVLAGANVLMFNLSPADVVEKYTLYDNKICLTENIEKSLLDLEKNLINLGYSYSVGRGDY